MKKNIIIPKTIWGHELSKTNKKERIIKYIVESIIFSLILTTIQIIVFLFLNLLDIIHFTNNKSLNIVISFIILFGIAFIIAFFLNTFISEFQVKLYEKKLEK